MNRKICRVEMNGKVNLSLNITGKSQDLHVLDTVMASVSLADVVTVAERFDGRTNVEFCAPFAVPEQNTVTKTLALVTKSFPGLGVDVFVEKRLPLCGGMGGSSADSAAVILALDSLFSLSERGFKPYATALQAGSDVPFMLSGGLQRVTGVGDGLVSFAASPLFLVLCQPNGGVSTAHCYAAFDALYPACCYSPADNDALIFAWKHGDLSGVAAQLHNALMQPARTLCPEIDKALRAVAESGAMAVFMTGSGAVCCGLFADMASARAAQKHLSQSGHVAYAVQTVDPGFTMRMQDD